MLLKLFRSIQKNVIPTSHSCGGRNLKSFTLLQVKDSAVSLVSYTASLLRRQESKIFYSFASKRLSSFTCQLHRFAPAKAGIYCFLILYFCTSCVPTVDIFSELTSEDVEDRFYIKFDVDHYTNSGVAVPRYELSSDDRIGLFDCGVDKDSESIEDMYCILDLNEADIGVLGQAEEGIPIQYNVPRGMCKYTTFMAPWHWNQRSGVGPSYLEKCTEKNTEDGAEDEYYCHETNPNENDPGTTGDCRFTINDENCTRSNNWKKINEDKTLSQAFCDLYDLTTNAGDNSNSSLKNCCFGTYEVIGGEEEETGEWGGDARECIGGPIRISDWNAYTKTLYGDLPTKETFSSWTRGVRRTLTVGPVIDGTVMFTSVPTATYFDGIEDLIFTDLSCPNCPGMLLPDDRVSSAPPFLRAYPYFTLECLNSNYESLHTIHLIIREWNTREEFISFKDSDGRSGDPDLDGEEGGDCNYYEADEKLGNTTRCNDFSDLDDFLNATQASSTLDSIVSHLNFLSNNTDIQEILRYLPYPHVDYEGSGGGGQ